MIPSDIMIFPYTLVSESRHIYTQGTNYSSPSCIKFDEYTIISLEKYSVRGVKLRRKIGYGEKRKWEFISEETPVKMSIPNVFFFYESSEVFELGITTTRGHRTK